MKLMYLSRSRAVHRWRKGAKHVVPVVGKLPLRRSEPSQPVEGLPQVVRSRAIEPHLAADGAKRHHEDRMRRTPLPRVTELVSRERSTRPRMGEDPERSGSGAPQAPAR